MLFRPGFLTIEYLAGRRIRYFEPFKLFIFISFLYFLASGLLHHRPEADAAGTVLPVTAGDTAANARSRDGYHLTLDKRFDKVIAVPEDSLRKMVKKEGLNRFVNMKYPSASWWAKFMVKQVIKDRLNGSLSFNRNMGKTIPKLIFVLIPVFAFLLKLIYFRKKIYYYNHVIFSFHFLSFFFLMNLARETANLVSQWITPVIYLLVMLYLVLSLRRVYEEKIMATLWKFFLFFFGSVFILITFFIMAAMISFLMI